MTFKIKHRLWLIALAALVTLGLTFTVSTLSNRVVSLLEHGALRHSVSTLRTIAEVSDLLHRAHFQSVEVLTLAPDAPMRPAQINARLTEVQRLLQRIDTIWTEEYRLDHEDDPEELILSRRFSDARAAWSAAIMSMGQATEAGIVDARALNEFIQLGAPSLAEANSVLETLREHQVAVGNQVLNDAELLQTELHSRLVVLGLVGGLTLAVIALITGRRIQRGMAEAERVAVAIADGNLDVSIPRRQHDEFDALISHMGLMRDSLKGMIQTVRESESRTHAVLRTMRDGVIQISPDGTILSVNDVMTELFGYEEQDMIGKNVSALMPDSFAREHDGYLARYRSSRIPRILHRRVELEAKRSDGTIFPIDLVVNEMVDDRGSVFIGVMRDIVEQKRTQQALEVAVTDAKAAAEAKSAFLANMSHEIRTPINAVIGFSLLAQRLKLEAPVRAYFDKISASAQALLAIINDILDLSKIEAGKLDIEAIDFSLDESLKHLHTLLSHKAQAKGIELVVGALPDVPTQLIGDPTRLSQVLVNLCTNAVKFTEQGHVTVLVERIEGRHEDGPVRLRFSVKDTGIGIPEHQQAKLFQSFTQVDSSTSRKFGGTGLGLAICKELVERMGGAIGLKSAAGEGAEFWFELPFNLSQIQLPNPPQERAASLGGIKVLVVDDNKVIRTLMMRMLEKLGCEAVTVEDGEGALAQMASGTDFDVVALDWNLPGIDGLEVARQMRAQGFEGPIVMITGMGDEALPESHGEVNAMLAKPVSLDVLRQTLTDALSGQASKVEQRLHDTVLPTLTGRRILVVDDNEFNREIASELLAMTGARVDTAVNGERGVSAVLGDAFELVLMDVQMPVMDGYEAARLIRKSRPTLPIIALTAHAMKEERDRVLAAGMNDLLTKPIDHQSFYRMILRWLPEAANPPVAAAEVAAPVPAAVTETAADDATGTTIFDRDGALARVGGSAQMLERFMTMFWDRNASLVDDIGQALEQGDRDVARRHAHSLKGGAGTVGLVELQDEAADLEVALKEEGAEAADDDTLDALFERISRAWARARAATQADIDS